MFHCCLIVLSSVCTVLCLIAILDVQTNQRARSDIHCHWESGTFLVTYTPAAHSVCMPGKPSSSFQGAVKNHSDSSPASLSYQKTRLKNPHGFGTKQWELPELQPLLSQPDNPTGHTSQGYRGEKSEFLYRAHQAHLSLPKTQDQTWRAGSNLPFPGPAACSPWVQPSYGTPKAAVLDFSEIRDDQHEKSSEPLIKCYCLF